jgi:hypothetical protein
MIADDFNVMGNRRAVGDPLQNVSALPDTPHLQWRAR